MNNNNNKLIYALSLQLEMALADLKIDVDTNTDANYGKLELTLAGEIEGVGFVIYVGSTSQILQNEETGEQRTIESVKPSEIIRVLFNLVRQA